MKNPFTNQNHGIQAQTFDSTDGLPLINYSLGGRVGQYVVPGSFWIKDENWELEGQLGSPWEKGVQVVGEGDERKELNAWLSPFLPPHVIIAVRMSKSYYVASEGRKYTFPYMMARNKCEHPTLGYQLDGAQGVTKSLARQLLVMLVDNPQAGPFVLSLPKGGAKMKLFDNDPNNKKYYVREMAPGITQVLAETCEVAEKWTEETFGSATHFAEYATWIGTAIPMEGSDGKPVIIDFGSVKKSPINPFVYSVLGNDSLDNIPQYCLLSAQNQPLNARVGEIIEEYQEWIHAWDEDQLMEANSASQVAQEEEEEDNIPF